MSASEFMARRIIRIVPLYWSITTFFIVMMFVAPTVFQSSRFDLNHVLSSYLFFPYEHPVTHQIQPVVIPGWTLNYEMFFYVLFAIWLPIRREFRIGGILITLVAVTLLRFAGDNEAISFYASPLILEFGFGVVIAHLVHKGFYLPRFSAFVAIPFFVGAVWAADYANLHEGRFLLWGLPAAFLVFSATSYERKSIFQPQRQLELVGNASYSIYLSHGIALSAVSQFWQRLLPHDSGISLAIFCLAAVTAAVIMGIGLYWFFERPVERFGKNLIRRRFSRDWALRPTNA